MKRRLAIVGIVFLLVGFFLMTVGLVSQNVKAESAAGTWTGTCTRTTYVSVYYYDVVLELSGDSSVSGTLTLTCTDVQGSSGWIDKSAIGQTNTANVYGTVSGSELTLQMNIYTLTLGISGDTMTGGGQGVDAANDPVTWSFSLTGGGGLFGFGSLDVYSLAIPSASLSFIGGILGLAASSLPAPRGLMGFRGRTRKQPHYRHPIVTQKYRTSPPPPPPVVIPPPPPAVAPAALRDPNETLAMPLQPPGTTIGAHQVPWDAPMQCLPNRNPDEYPYGRGTSANMRCPYCGCNTLSPFTTGWFCTNPLCPARREWLQKRCTHHEFNNMTWRVL